jgi:hypothetical protein
MTDAYDSTLFTKYAENGRVLEVGMMAFGALQHLRLMGQPYLHDLQLDHATQWVEVVDGVPAAQTRPALGLPESLQAGVYEEAVLPGLPACTLAFSGPVAGSQEHPGGDAEVGFAVPGTYTLTGEPFPYLPFAVTLTVTEDPEP